MSCLSSSSFCGAAFMPITFIPAPTKPPMQGDIRGVFIELKRNNGKNAYLVLNIPGSVEDEGRKEGRKEEKARGLISSS
jgi:hypothetical protein